MLRRVGLISLSLILAILFLMGIQYGMASANPTGSKPVKLGPDLVCNVPASYSTIQSAINDPTCDEIIIAAGIFSESLVITRSVTIRGAGSSFDATQTRLNNDLKSRVIEIPSHGSFGPDIVVSISDLNIEEGYATGGGLDSLGGGIHNAETLILNNIYMINNIAGSGGAIGTQAYAVTTIMNSYLAVNSAVDPGAYIGDNIKNSAVAGRLTISNTTLTAGLFSSCITTSGPTFIYDSVINGHAQGGIYATASLVVDNTEVSSNGEFGVSLVGLTTSPITATIRNSIIQDNSDPTFSGDAGEGIAAVANVNLTVDNTTVQRNVKEGIAGQTQLGYFPVLTVTNSIVQDNYDGGIESVGDLTILDSKVSGNTRINFGLGGVYISGADLRIERSEITNNEGGACGAGVLVNGASARIRDTTISYNQSDSGAGICIYNEGDATIRRSAIYSNTT